MKLKRRNFFKSLAALLALPLAGKAASIPKPKPRILIVDGEWQRIKGTGIDASGKALGFYIQRYEAVDNPNCTISVGVDHGS